MDKVGLTSASVTAEKDLVSAASYITASNKTHVGTRFGKN